MMPIVPEGADQGFVETPIGKVHYVSAGSGPPLFLLHGGHGSWVHWHVNLMPLANRHTVFALDMPGFGQSADAPASGRIEDVAQSVWDTIAALRATLSPSLRNLPVDIAGFSFGTLVAATLASRQPQAVRALLLVNPPGLGEVSQEVRQVQARAADAARIGGLRAGLEITLRELLLCRPERADAFALELLEHGVVNTRLVSRSLSRAARLIPLLGTLKPSVHVVLGENDPHQRHELAARRTRLEAALGASCVSLFADASHWLQYDQPERFNELALRVFARCDVAVHPE
jgi:pimeloyl-ACP methyl ester carboxylesterase